MAVLYLAGQRPGSGVTSIAAALATSWRKAGRRVAVIKPAALTENDDAAFYERRFGSPEGPPLIVSNDSRDKKIATAAKRVADLEATFDTVIVEGLPYTDADGKSIGESPTLAEQTGAKVLGVISYDHSLTSADARAWREAYASSLAGVVFNRRPKYGEHDATHRLVPAFEDAGVPVHGVLPEQRLLLAPTVKQVADLLNGTFYSGIEGRDALIEHFLIGGLITEWGGNYFNRLPDQAVFVRGGRMDIQMSALNFPTVCLFLTGCERPPQYVHQRAQDLDVPLVTVNHDTHSTAGLLEQVAERVTVDHPDKIALLTRMVEEAVDFEAIGGPVSVRTA